APPDQPSFPTPRSSDLDAAEGEAADGEEDGDAANALGVSAGKRLPAQLGREELGDQALVVGTLGDQVRGIVALRIEIEGAERPEDRKSTRLNSSHQIIA